MTTEEVTEVVTEAIGRGEKSADGIVRNVKVLGTRSKNKGGVYPAEVMREAVGLYEGAKVNIDHTRESDRNPSFRDRFGVIRNARLVGEEIRGDLHFNPKHAAAEQFIWAVENQPETIGFSHIAMVDWKPTKGGRIAQKIRSVKSVDIVAEPATTAGVFEEAEPEEKPDDAVPLTGRSRAISALSDDVFAFIEPGGKKDASGRTTPRAKRLWPLDSADAVRVALNSIPRMTRLSEEDRNAARARAMRAAAKFRIKLPTLAAQSSEDAMADDIAGITMEEFRALRPDLVDALVRESSTSSNLDALTKENEILKKRIATFEEAEAKAKKAAELNEALEEAGLDPGNPKHVGKLLRRTLESISDPKELAEAIEERREELAEAGLLDAEDVEGDEKPTKESRVRATPKARPAGGSGVEYSHESAESFAKSLRRGF